MRLTFSLLTAFAVLFVAMLTVGCSSPNTPSAVSSSSASAVATPVLPGAGSNMCAAQETEFDRLNEQQAGLWRAANEVVTPEQEAIIARMNGLLETASANGCAWQRGYTYTCTTQPRLYTGTAGSEARGGLKQGESRWEIDTYESATECPRTPIK